MTTKIKLSQIGKNLTWQNLKLCQIKKNLTWQNWNRVKLIDDLAVESSSDEDEESSEDEKMETETAEKEPEAPKKGEKFRSGYGSD